MTTAPASAPPSPRRDRSWRPRAWRATLWSSLAGMALLLTSVLVAWSWRDELPAQVATHWSAGGSAPDGFSSPGTFILTSVLTGLGICALFGTICALRGAAAPTRRIAAGGCVWAGAFAGTMLLTTLAPQRGLADASQVTMSSGALLATFLLPLVPWVVTAFLVPGDPALPASGPVVSAAPRATLRDGERVVWLRRTTGGPALAIGAGAVCVTAVVAVMLQLWAMLVVPVLLTGLLLAMFAFTVRVDATGLTARSALGWPGTHVPADEVLRASVTEVRPFPEFGGWGWRVSRDGRVGVVLRGGQALLVERTGGRSFTVTVEGADDAAALLNTMADRARSSAPGQPPRPAR